MMRGLPKECLYTLLKTDYETAAADTAVTITAAAIADQYHVLRQIDVSYANGTPTAAGLTVQINSVTVWAVDLPLTTGGHVHSFEFPWGLYTGVVNQAMTITATDPAEASTVIKLFAAWE
jgi:hypothetical protein